MRIATRQSLLLLNWLLASAVIAQEEPVLTIKDYYRHREEVMLAGCKSITGVIEAVEPAPGGAAIRVRPEVITESRKRQKAGEKPPHPEATIRELDGLNARHPPVVWLWPHSTKKVVSFHWKNSDGPPPLCRGMSVEQLTLDASGNVVDLSFIATVTHWRKRADGLVEVVLGCGGTGTPLQFLYACPGRMDGGNDIHWTRKWGMLINSDAEFGAPSIEIESLGSGRRGLRLANTDKMEIVPGRDGWKVLPAFSLEQLLSKKRNPAAEKTWEEFCRAIPKRQQMNK